MLLTRQRSLKSRFPELLSLIALLASFSGITFGKTLTLVTINHPPHSYLEEGRVTGAVTMAMRQAFSDLGYKVEIKLVPPIRALKMVELGSADGIYPYTQNTERLEHAYLSRPIASVETVFFKRRNESINWASMEDLQPYRIGIFGGYNYSPEIKDPLHTGRLDFDIFAHGDATLLSLEKLKAKRIDLLVCDPNVCNFLKLKHAPDFDDIDYIDKPISARKSFHIGFSKQHKNARILRDAFDETFSKLIKNGTIHAIFREYGLEQIPD